MKWRLRKHKLLARATLEAKTALRKRLLIPLTVEKGAFYHVKVSQKAQNASAEVC